MENFRDLRAGMTDYGLLTLSKDALHDAGVALRDARKLPLNVAIADRFHQAAGPIAMMGANRLHRLLCALEDAVRADNFHAMEPLLNDAMKAKQETEDWITGALSEN
jgi:hypothetical protein